MIRRLALGTVQFGLSYGVANSNGKVHETEVGRILEEAARLRIDTLDTAIGYGDSEAVLGCVGVSDYRIITKMPGIPEADIDIDDWIMEQMRASLSRLCTDRVYAVLLHRPDQLLGPRGEQLYRALQRLKSVGLTQKTGISVYAPEELDALQSHYDFDLVQAPLNILDRRLVESGWTERFAEMGGELHVRSVFLQGLLLMNAHERPTAFDRWNEIWTEWETWLTESGLTSIQACLRYALSIRDVERIVVGVNSLDQLRQIASVIDGPLPPLPRWPSILDDDLLNPSHWNLS